MKRHFSIIILVLSISCLLSACGSGKNSIVGTWEISQYEVSDETISADEISDYLGDNAKEFNKYSIVFTKTGNVTLTRPDFRGGTTDIKLAYTVQDGQIEIYDPDDTTDFELYPYEDGKIKIEIGGNVIAIFEKK